MAKTTKSKSVLNGNANLGFEAKLWLAANVFCVPKEARWPQLQAKAQLPSIGKDVDDAMVALERDNPRLKGALKKNYGRADLGKHRLGELIDLIGSISLIPSPRGRGQGEGKGLKRRDRRKQTLFIDARKMGTLSDRVHRKLTDADLEKIVGTYHAWRGGKVTPSPLAGEGRGEEKARQTKTITYTDTPGFCKSATTTEIATHGYVLTPGRNVCAEAVEDDGEPFEEKMLRLVAELQTPFGESEKLSHTIRDNLTELGFR